MRDRSCPTENSAPPRVDHAHLEVIVTVARQRTTRRDIRAEQRDLGRAPRGRCQARDRAAEVMRGVLVDPFDRHGRGSFGRGAAHHPTPRPAADGV
jgi:hypothetical protein